MTGGRVCQFPVSVNIYIQLKPFIVGRNSKSCLIYVCGFQCKHVLDCGYRAGAGIPVNAGIGRSAHRPRIPG